MSDTNQALVLDVSARINKLENAFKKAEGTVDGSSRNMERRAKSLTDHIEKTVGQANVAGALEKVFDSSRLRILDEGSARINVFGSALEELGPVGLTAAAGIIAVGEALNISREAAAFAHDIETTANRLHVTTNALQEYRFAVRAAGGEEKGADEALEAFNITLGKAQAGLPKAMRGFAELGFTKAQVKNIQDGGEALDDVVTKIAGLPNVQKDAVIDQLGLTGLKPLIEAGVDKMKELREEARRAGVVMDEGLVKRGAQIHEQFETVSQVIDVQLKSALVDLGPILVDLLGLVAQMAKFAGEVADGFRSIPDKTDTGLQRNIDQAQGKIAAILEQAKNAPFQNGNLTSSQRAAITKESQIIAANQAEQVKRSAADAADAKALDDKTKADALADLSKTPRSHTARDDSATRSSSVDSAAASAQRDLDQALEALATDASSRADLQKAMLADEQAQKAASFARQKAEIDNDRGISAALKTQLKASVDIAAAREAQAAQAKAAAIDIAAQAESAQQALERQRERAGFEIDTMNAEKSIASTRKEQLALELAVLARQKALDDAERRDALADKRRRAVASDAAWNAAHPDQPQRTTVVSDGGVQSAADTAYNARVRAVTADYGGTLQQYLKGIQDIDTAMQAAEVQGLEGLNDGLARLIAQGGKAKDVIHQVLTQLAEDLAKIGLQQIESGLFSLFSFDGGGFTGPGIRSGGVDGKGGFPALLHPNETVIDHTRPMALSGHSAVYVAGPTFNLQGAVVTQDLLDQMNGISRRHAAQAGAMAVDTARRSMLGWQAQNAAEQG